MMKPEEKEELKKFVGEQIEVFDAIQGFVRPYVDELMRSCGIDPDQPDYHVRTTRFALIMELARSIFVNWSVRKRYKPR